MIPLGMLGQVYAVCAGIGSIFVIGSFLLGHVEGEGAHHHHHGGHDDGGGGSDFGASDDGGNYRMATTHAHRTVITHHKPQTNTLAQGFFGVILTLLSPMTVSIYLAFFGLTGLLLAWNATWMGYFSIIPAAAVSIGVSALFKYMTNWMIKNLHSSTHQKQADLLGQLAEVIVPIADGRIGEVTYVLNSKRMTATAKPAKAGLNFKKGSRVLIVGSKDHVVFIEPYDTDDELEQRFISQG